MITLSHAKKLFSTSSGAITALDDVTLTVERGQIFGIIGYSGAGKSTLIRLLNGLERPDSGSVIVGDLDLSVASEAQLARARPKIGMIFQHFNLLWSRTVAGNIAFALEIAGVDKSAIPARVAELIRLVGLEGRGGAYPSQLSGGQKQRVGIARALANRPDVLLCDEATSALDPETTDSILDLLLSINRRFNLTIVLITHEMHVVRRICDVVAVMEAGRIVEQGTVAELQANAKQPVTRRFLRQLTEDAEAQELDEGFDPYAVDIGSGALVRLVASGAGARDLVLADVARRFNLSLDIVHGHLSFTREGASGELYVEVPAKGQELVEVLAWLAERDIAAEIVRRG
ncbi:methionine ABC transporter ATP-binding protein [Pseudochelatococcus contaminans]|uniref:D-methionine transport system ATP-binding protein n=1 Tax=Pseudochelatococcus contaminans TaxID=1538103 RepID=A0A7W5Z3Q1_9HYPH|nr:ATP-binding cassette domain-containing protein [Pseudochelatococcus contaminans]MBB3809590.1 D-methionine transport system ATP-binding protein [Pseudochelatococcus contaminans]